MHTIKLLIEKGLYQDNLEEIIISCKNNFDKSPLLYFTIISVLELLEIEFNGSLATERYDQINNTLQPLLIKAIDNPSQHSLEKLVIEAWKLTG